MENYQKKYLNGKKSSSKYYESFNNTFLNYLAQSNYDEDSFNIEGQNEDNNNF